jgi:1-acyl-sn-glycerol-3-phosphate acyltransferase
MVHGSPVYRAAMATMIPVVRWWGRLEVVGVEHLSDGPVLVVGNHDSNWDPLVIGVAAADRVQIRAMAKSELWRRPALAWVLDRMGQLKITRGRADRAELAAVRTALVDGHCVGVFPEGRLSRGHKIRAYSGAGWLAKSVPTAKLVGVTITGAVDLVRFPHRPRIRVEFFVPLGGPRAPGESSIGVSRRVLAEIRDRAPAVAAGRHPVHRSATRPSGLRA